MVLAAILTAFAGGCAPVISKDLRAKAEKELSFREVIRNPDAYHGRVVIWGGRIIETKNLEKITLIEVLQTPLDSRGKPKEADLSLGRFLAQYEGYLDAAVYEQGRKVTVAGEIVESDVRTVGEFKYRYPVIAIGEIHLWPTENEQPYPPDPYWHYPWWPYHPYWSPWYW
jgi:outer membrane lipoprotein